jgi:hypothetical protein
MKPLIWLLALALPLAGTGRVHADAIYDNGAVINLSTNLNDNAIVRDSSGGQATTLNILAGGIVNNLTLQGHSSLNFTQGFNSAIRGTLSTYDSSTAFVNGIGSPFQNLDVHDSSKVTTNGIVQASRLSADGFGMLHIVEAEGISLTAAGHSTVIVDSYNNHGSIAASGSASMILNNMIMHGGTLSVLDSATVTLLGVQANLFQSGIFRASVSGTGRLTIYGSGFNYGSGALTDHTGTLTGTLENGTQFRMTFTGGHNIYLVTTPEPSTLALAGLGVLSLAAYSWQRMRKGAGQPEEILPC